MAVVVEQSGFDLVPEVFGGGTIDIPMFPSQPHDLLVVLIDFYLTVAGIPLNPLTQLTYKGAFGVRQTTFITGGTRRELWTVAGAFDGAAADATFEIDGAFDGAVCAVAIGVALSGTQGIVTGIRSATTTSSTPQVTVLNTDPTSLVMDFLAVNHGSVSFATRAVGGGQTLIRDVQTQGTGDVTQFLSGSSSSEPGGGNVVMSWTLSASKTWGMLGFEIPANQSVPQPRQDIAVEARGPRAATTHVSSLACQVDVGGPRRSSARIVPAQQLAVDTKLELLATHVVARISPAVIDGPIGNALTTHVGPREDRAVGVGTRTATRIVPRTDLAVRTVQEGITP